MNMSAKIIRRLFSPNWDRVQCSHSDDSEIFTHLTEDELRILEELARTLREKAIVVEIGSYLGASSCALARGAVKADAMVFCVDTWRNDAMSEGPRDTWEEFMTNTRPYRKQITAMRGMSREIAPLFTERIDMLFVDGDHSWEGVATDLALWLPKLAPGAWLVLHDIGWADGVQRAASEIVEPLISGRSVRLPNLIAAQVTFDSETHHERPTVNCS